MRGESDVDVGGREGVGRHIISLIRHKVWFVIFFLSILAGKHTRVCHFSFSPLNVCVSMKSDLCNNLVKALSGIWANKIRFGTGIDRRLH